MRNSRRKKPAVFFRTPQIEDAFLAGHARFLDRSFLAYRNASPHQYIQGCCRYHVKRPWNLTLHLKGIRSIQPVDIVDFVDEANHGNAHLVGVVHPTHKVHDVHNVHGTGCLNCRI